MAVRFEGCQRLLTNEFACSILDKSLLMKTLCIESFSPRSATIEAAQVVFETFLPLKPTKSGTMSTMMVPVKLPCAAVVVSKPIACKKYAPAIVRACFFYIYINHNRVSPPPALAYTTVLRDFVENLEEDMPHRCARNLKLLGLLVIKCSPSLLKLPEGLR